MSEPEFEKYLFHYNKLMELMIELHNKHISYKKYRGKVTVKLLRNVIREITRNQKPLRMAALASFFEFRANSKKRQQQAKEGKLKRTRKKKNDNNGTNESNV